MMVARVLKTIDVSGLQGAKQLVVEETDVSIRCFKGLPREADNAVGAAEGDLVLCSACGGRLIAVGIIDTIKLVGTKVYQRGDGRQKFGDYSIKAITR